jgi:hypothetical protein
MLLNIKCQLISVIYMSYHVRIPESLISIWDTQLSFVNV